MDDEDGEGRSITRLLAVLEAVPRDLSLPVLVTLMVVAVDPGMSVNDLGDRIGAPQQTASRYASVLLGRYQAASSTSPPQALIEQRVNEADPRKRALFPTNAGVELIRTLIAAGWPTTDHKDQAHVRG